MDKDNKINPVSNKNGLSRDLIPDSAKEWAAIGSAIAHLGTMASGVTLFTANHWWTLGTIFVTWLGHSVHAYMKLHDKTINGDNDTPAS